jgi:hypothetical protein
MPSNKKIELYNGEISIEFNENNHRYIVNGKSGTPSVTSVTGILNKPSLIYWAVNLMRDYLLDALKNGTEMIMEDLVVEASRQHTIKKTTEATSGSLVHEWCEKYIKGEKPEIPEDPRVLNGVNAFLSWVEENKPKFLFSEKICYSKQYNFVGIIDCAFTLGKEKHKIKHIGDFKTSSAIYPEMILQVSAYQAAEEEESGNEYGDKWILRFGKDDGNFEAKSFPLSQQKNDFEVFTGLLKTKNWLKQVEVKNK